MDVITDKLHVWGLEDIEPKTINQAVMAAKLSIVHPYIALMPDAHVGFGSTVGSVIPTKGAVIPGAVGVDIGCGMAAVETDLMEADLPNLELLMPLIEQVIPAGPGKGHDRLSRAADRWLGAHRPPHALTTEQTLKAERQLGSLGGGNHFLEVSIDEHGKVWVVLHSGSRGIGNDLARSHMDKAKELKHLLPDSIEDPDLAYFLQGTPEFEAYLADLLWAQGYARANRELMLTFALETFFEFVGRGKEVRRINCHHNYTVQEEYDGQTLWITRKGAIEASAGKLGIIPGSMGTDTYIVEGLGNPASFNSSSHGAGRVYSRAKAEEKYDAADLAQFMSGKVWNHAHAPSLVDEIPAAYKDIAKVMSAQSDLVRPVARLEQRFNFKGYGEKKRRNKKYKDDDGHQA